MSHLTVEVIVNNFNYARYLGPAIDSALDQTYQHVRVIVVDDGSTDESRAVIESYGRRIDAVFKENGGQASAINAGFNRSTADAVIFLDADDMLVRDIVGRVVEAFSSDGGLAKVQYPMEVIDGEGRRTGVRKPPVHVPLRSGDLRAQKLAFPFDVAWMATSGNAFARKLLGRIMPIPEDEFALLADWYLNHLIPFVGPLGTLDAVGAYYRVHGRNSYERSEAALDLAHVRRTIDYTARVRPYLERLAAEEGSTGPRRWCLVRVRCRPSDDLPATRSGEAPDPSRHGSAASRQWRTSHASPVRRPTADEGAVRDVVRRDEMGAAAACTPSRRALCRDRAASDAQPTSGVAPQRRRERGSRDDLTTRARLRRPVPPHQDHPLELFLAEESRSDRSLIATWPNGGPHPIGGLGPEARWPRTRGLCPLPPPSARCSPPPRQPPLCRARRYSCLPGGRRPTGIGEAPSHPHERPCRLCDAVTGRGRLGSVDGRRRGRGLLRLRRQGQSDRRQRAAA